MKSGQQDNNFKMYSTLNEERSIVAKRFIRTLKKYCKHLTSVSKNVYIYKVADKPWMYVIQKFNGEEIVGNFYKK